MSQNNADKAQVKLFSADWCGYCKMAKAYLSEKGIDFEEVNVDQDPAAAAWIVEKTGQRGVPVLLFADKDVVLGFNRPQIDLLIREHNLA